MSESRIFVNRVICGHCGLPLPKEDFDGDNPVCRTCVGDRERMRVSLALAKNDVFTSTLDELRKGSRPATTDAANAFLAAVGGAEGFGQRLGEDLRRVRGEDLSPAQKEVFEVNHNALTRFYTIGQRFMEARDQMIAGSESLKDISDTDLEAQTFEVALMRVRESRTFAKSMLTSIAAAFPDLFMEVAEKAAGVIEYVEDTDDDD